LRIVRRRGDGARAADDAVFVDHDAHAHLHGRQVRGEQLGWIDRGLVLAERRGRDPMLVAGHRVAGLVGGGDLGHRDVAGAGQVDPLHRLLRGAGHEQHGEQQGERLIGR
jgi:hypothetical protein